MLYELHVGAFTEEGTFDGMRRRLDYLAELGVTAVELMPLSDFAGTRNWGYDGVMPFAPDAAYGSPDDLKRLIDEAHGRGLMMFLDVVYNHFGPVGNYLHRYAESFFEPEEHTPWGAAINYKVRAVRDFAIHNVLYWLEEFRFDGLRFDAVDRIIDRGEEHILKEIAATVRRTIPAERHVHLVLENDKNQAHLLERDPGGRPIYYDAQWNDDIHHVYHHLLTGEAGGYYADYATDAHERLGARAQLRLRLPGRRLRVPGRRGARRAERSSAADRIRRVHPEPRSGRQPRVRRTHRGSCGARGGQGHAGGISCSRPTFRSCSWARNGARPSRSASSPIFTTSWRTPCARAGDASSKGSPSSRAKPRARTSRIRTRSPRSPRRVWTGRSRSSPSTGHGWSSCASSYAIRHEMIVPRLGGIRGHAGKATILSDSALRVTWTLADGSTLELIANLADRASPVTPADEVAGDVLFANHPDLPAELRAGRLPPWSVLWLLHPRAS